MSELSGTHSGPGYGNKSSGGFGDEPGDLTRFGSAGDTSSYSGGTAFGSGTTGGAGSDNHGRKDLETGACC